MSSGPDSPRWSRYSWPVPLPGPRPDTGPSDRRPRRSSTGHVSTPPNQCTTEEPVINTYVTHRGPDTSIRLSEGQGPPGGCHRYDIGTIGRPPPLSTLSVTPLPRTSGDRRPCVGSLRTTDTFRTLWATLPIGHRCAEGGPKTSTLLPVSGTRGVVDEGMKGLREYCFGKL